MANCAVTLFPKKNGATRSQNIHVKCGEMVMVEGYGCMDDVCVEFYKVDSDPCSCLYEEKPFCIKGKHVGLGGACTTALLTMPGCYVAYICGEGDDFTVRAETLKCLDNLSVTIQGVAAGI